MFFNFSKDHEKFQTNIIEREDPGEEEEAVRIELS
jgi:hypothetical protein